MKRLLEDTWLGLRIWHQWLVVTRPGYHRSYRIRRYRWDGTMVVDGSPSWGPCDTVTIEKD